MHHADARLQRVEGGVELHLLAIDQDVAAVAAGFPDHGDRAVPQGDHLGQAAGL